MRVTLVHNEYARLSGEDVMVSHIARTLREHGHSVSLFLRHSAEISRMRFGRIRAFFSGIHSFKATRSLERLLVRERPDIVHIQNVYPLISPGAFEVAGRLGIPIVFRAANYRLFCPSGLLLSRGRICEQCAGGREYWCTLRNCEGTFCKSLGYSLRNGWMRLTRAVERNVSLYVVPSAFQRNKFIAWGIPQERIAVVPNLVPPEGVNGLSESPGSYVAYAGRISPEKGVDTLLEAMRQLPEIPCRIAGDLRSMPELAVAPPKNVQFLGPVSRDRISSFYAHARMLVVPSVCYETFGLVIGEAMLHGLPAVGSRIGAIPEVIDEGRTGLLFEPGNAAELAFKIRLLWNRTDLCRQMGTAGRKKVLEAFCPETFYRRLMHAYEKAILLARQLREVAA
ncbi:MAG: glycosyltransferase [Sedimentisphaerales bacterium]|nr:glycosyltransferase [Sedimentisphaerales bacterium]